MMLRVRCLSLMLLLPALMPAGCLCLCGGRASHAPVETMHETAKTVVNPPPVAEVEPLPPIIGFKNLDKPIPVRQASSEPDSPPKK